MPGLKPRVFMIGVLISFAVVFALPAAASCYECTYIWFVGHECDGCEPETETFPESDRSVVRLAEAAVGPAPRAAAPQCRYRID